jgi:hypothetical protein
MNSSARQRLKASNVPLGRTEPGTGNDSPEPRSNSDIEPEREARLGGSLAPLDDHHSETIDHRPACFRSGLGGGMMDAIGFTRSSVGTRVIATNDRNPSPERKSKVLRYWLAANYSVAILIATIGWFWLIAWIAMHLNSPA